MSLASRACQILSLAGHVKISLWRALNAQVNSLNLQLSVTKKKWNVNTCKKIKKKNRTCGEAASLNVRSQLIV